MRKGTTMMQFESDPHAQLVPVPATAAAFTRPSWIRATGTCARPAVLPTAVLVAARWWNIEGAEHSPGDAALFGVLTGVSLVAGWVSASNSDHLSRGAAVGFGLAGALAAAGVVGYSSGLALPVLLWTVASGLAITLSSLARAAEKRHRRRLAEAEEVRRAEDERRERAAAAWAERRMQRAQLASQTTVTVEALRAYSAVSVAELAAAAKVAVAELAAGTAHSALPGMDRVALPATERRALAAYLAGSAAGTEDEDGWLREISAG